MDEHERALVRKLYDRQVERLNHIQEMRESINRLEAMILAQGDELRAQSQTIRELTARLNGLK